MHVVACVPKSITVTEIFPCIIFHNFMKIIHTVKGDFILGMIFTSDEIAWWFLIVMMYIQRLFLTIYDCSDPVGNLRPKKCRISVQVGKFCETVVNRKDSCTTKFTIYDLLWIRGQVSNTGWASRFLFLLWLNYFKKNNRFLHESLLKIWDFFHECEKFRLFTSGA
jgi:hypothetical protein